ncbi:MAG TPA: substrate-binding domain-containing protein, partial [Pseudonocardiaceae bacterium]|nr:substrate-binding domain-containing protein [Pseudonocardiaceae bacterium]
MAHHRKHRRLRAALITLAVVALAGVIAATTTVVIRKQQAQCSGQLNVGVTAAPAIAPIVTNVAKDFNGTNPVADGHCVTITVNAESSAAAAGELPTDQVSPPAVWIPDSSLWAGEVSAQASTLGAFAPKIDVGPSLAASPLVLAAPESLAHTIGWPATKPSWRALAGGALPGVLGNPTTTSEGLASVLMLETVLSEPMTSPSTQLAGLLVKLGPSSVTDIAGQFTTDTGPHAHVFTASEQAVTAANRNGGPTKFVAVTPSDGTLVFNYPVVTVTSRADLGGTATAAAAFEQALRTPQTAAMVTSAGFQDPAGKTPGARNLPVTAAVSTLLRTWVAVNLDTRFLTVIDVSGSMGEANPTTGQTKAEIVRDATNVGLAEFPDTSQIGLWEFGDQLAPPDDWREVVPIGALGGPFNGTTRRAALEQATAALPSVTHGGTALYSTAIAAYQNVLAGYDPTKVNAVLLMTDGSNDTNHGPDLATTVSQLRSMVDPTRPVPLFAVGIGDAADMNALSQIATATNGGAYRVDTAADIVNVFLDALVRRTCP